MPILSILHHVLKAKGRRRGCWRGLLGGENVTTSAPKPATSPLNILKIKKRKTNDKAGTKEKLV